MSQQKPAYQSIATDAPASNRVGRQGQQLYSLRDPVRWYILGVCIYAFASLGVLGWALTGPCDHNVLWSKVLQTGSLSVNQLYSGLALSLLFAPAGILVRRIANDLALLHPLAVASEQPVKLAHLDLMMDPGLLATLTLRKYSSATAVIQTILILTGALLVPIGTLLVTTGDYTGTAPGTAVVGIPGFLGSDMDNLNCAYTNNTSKDCFVQNSGAFSADDTFLHSIDALFRGTLISQSGVISKAPSHSGPVSTTNITLQEGVEYHGIVTYEWTSNCQYNKDVTYKFSTAEDDPDLPTIDFSLPNGSSKSWRYSITQSPFFAFASDGGSWSSDHSIPFDGSTYITLGYNYSRSVNVSRDTPGLDWVDFSDNVNDSLWLSRVKCTPALLWNLSDCVWHHDTWTDCALSPNQTISGIDVVDLDALTYYLTGLPFYSILEDPIGDDRLSFNGIFGNPAVITALTFAPNTPDTLLGTGMLAKPPLLTEYDNLYGFLTQLLATVSQNGYYGTAVVNTSGSASRPVYLVRMYILLIIIVLLVAVPALSLFILVSNIQRGAPLRRVTFLVIANAVRGTWWDETLLGGCAMSPEELRDTHEEQVTFGVDCMNREHVGLAPHVEKVEPGKTYWGVRRRGKPCL